MARSKDQKPFIISGLDIGSSKVSFVIGSLLDNRIDIVGIGTHPNSGMKQGVIVNIDSTIEAIKRAKEEAELMSGYSISSAWIGISGTHIQSFDSRGMVAIKESEVSEKDIQRVLSAAQAVAVPEDREVLHVLPRDYKIDQQDGIWDPIGMSGVRLEASVHIITSSKTALQNAYKSASKAGITPKGFVLSQLAASRAVIGEDEKSLGCALVDIGGGTTDVIIYANGSAAYTASIPIGGSHFTHDIAVGLRTPQTEADRLKIKFGCALSSLVDHNEMIEVAGVGGRGSRSVLRKTLCDVIEPRAEETLNLIQNEIHKSGLSNHLGSGIILTGGTSQLMGLIEMGEFIFETPVRLGTAANIGGLKEVVKGSGFSTPVGLLIHGLEAEQNQSRQNNNEDTSEKKDFFSQMGEKIKNLFA